MGSPISCIVIKSYRESPSAPVVGQTIRVLGYSGLFVIMSVDHQNKSLQAMETTGRHRLLDNVAFADVRRVNRNLASTIHRFLNSPANGM